MAAASAVAADAPKCLLAAIPLLAHMQGEIVSVLKVTQIKHKLSDLFEKHLDLSDISSSDAEREPKVLTRCLAALAVMLKSA